MNQKEVAGTKKLTGPLRTNSYKIEMKDVLLNQLKNKNVSSSFVSPIIESDKISSSPSESSELSLP